jgi:hypothetical protein
MITQILISPEYVELLLQSCEEILIKAEFVGHNEHGRIYNIHHDHAMELYYLGARVATKSALKILAI